MYLYSCGNNEINCYCCCCISCFNQYMAFSNVNHGVNTLEKQAKYKQEEQKHAFHPYGSPRAFGLYSHVFEPDVHA